MRFRKDELPDWMVASVVSNLGATTEDCASPFDIAALIVKRIPETTELIGWCEWGVVVDAETDAEMFVIKLGGNRYVPKFTEMAHIMADRLRCGMGLIMFEPDDGTERTPVIVLSMSQHKASIMPRPAES